VWVKILFSPLTTEITMRSLLLALVCFVSLPVFADYTTPNTNLKWTLTDLVNNSAGNVTFASGEYTVTGIITISTTDTLSITEDAILKFAVSTHFLVNGTIIINPPNGVTFTAIDQTAGFNGMRLDFSTASSLKKLTLEYAVSLNLRDCSPPIDSCIFRYNNNNASTTFGNGAVSLLRCNSTFTNCQFINNKRAAIQSGSNINNAPKIISCLLQGNNTTNQNVPQINLGATSTGNDTVKIINSQIINAGGIQGGGIGFLPIGSVYAVITGNVIKNNRYGVTFNGGSSINSIVSYNQIDSNNIQNNPALGGSGIAYSGGSSSSHQNSIITGNLIRWNLWGITIQNYAKPNLGDLSNGDTSDNGKNWFAGNTNTTTPGIHLYNNSPDPIAAQGNYWGSNDPTAIEASIFHQPDLGTLGLVDYSSYALPVELMVFSAARNDKDVVLKWQTVLEQNASHFEMERSFDGREFTVIGKVNAAGASGYNFTDINAAGVALYYRLKVVDKDGRFKYSQVVSIRKDKNEGIKIYPTIITAEAVIAEIISETSKTISIQLLNIEGKILSVITRNLFAGNNKVNIPVESSLPAGQLFVRITGDGIEKTISILKQ
jgi:hypothetical protein